MRVLGIACVTISTASADEPVFCPDAPFDRVATGFTFTEGPALGPDHTLYFSDIPAGKIWQVSPEGKAKEFLTPPGPTNGLAFDQQGRLLMCVTKGERKGIARRDADGTVHFLVDKYDGKPFIGPNDLAVDAQGRIYFTDPDYTTHEDPKPEIPPAVYCLKPPAEESGDWMLERVIVGLKRPNGIVVTPNNEFLYVSNRDTQKLHSYRIKEDGTLTDGFTLYDFAPDRGIDGMWLDVEGNIYGAAGEGRTTGLVVLSPMGRLLARRPMPEFSTNVIIGGPDGRDLYLTASKSVYHMRTGIAGNALKPAAKTE